jgi:electron transport complex protein RnfE
MSNKNGGSLSVLLNGIIKENPVLVLILGTCPTLAMTKNASTALGMGISVLIVLLCSNVAISLLRKVIPETVRIPCYIVIIAGFVTIVEMIVHAFLPDLYSTMGVFLKLITVNCIILGRAEMFASKNGIGRSALDGIGMGIGFTLAIFAIATLREVLGAGAFMGYEIPVLSDYAIKFFVEAPGGMLAYGLAIAAIYKLTNGKAPKKKSFACVGCPSAALCHAGGECCTNETNNVKEEGSDVR